MIKVLFVCLGNICRSPSAEGVFRKLVDEQGLGGAIEIDSAGTQAYHVGSPPDDRAQEAARRRGIDMSSQVGRRVDDGDFYTFDYILAMDESNEYYLREMAPPEEIHRIRRFLEFAPERTEREVPDPYYGGHGGFEHVLDLIEDASEGLLAEIKLRIS
ncbi:low molecular weight protein-tyrosine-phosphatase YfkJ [bacterium BMS3Bbin11]|nr:low molecular weight protein-tyrosine-phosphatase YfkJ [bacterium BMS3Abin11]GBE45047.1 low molecular weight protein-tyrosine-phosphatase YfkJ [bacterium BMS3Bbin11]GMT40940.1 MAG: phosphotyrosine protein phosphatase [bacterium]HDH09190.1 low molecular weight phosphotyrosine protein phosphatase [Gammaproteobacteria bacterium]HDH16389.1 low molecular weight phosphotyrosine protein phosphatase [Gammaproteobacteria bacterium]